MARSDKGYPRKWPKVHALRVLSEFVSRYGAVPAERYRHIATQHGCPSLTTVLKLWPSYRSALTEAGAVSRNNLAWSESDDDFLKERVGTMTFRTMAKRLNRTVAAVKFRMHILGIDQGSNDGRYTARTLARELGCHPSTVIERTKRGHYRGQKIGGIWRIDDPRDYSGEDDAQLE